MKMPMRMPMLPMVFWMGWLAMAFAGEETQRLHLGRNLLFEDATYAKGNFVYTGTGTTTTNGNDVSYSGFGSTTTDGSLNFSGLSTESIKDGSYSDTITNSDSAILFPYNPTWTTGTGTTITDFKSCLGGGGLETGCAIGTTTVNVSPPNPNYNNNDRDPKNRPPVAVADTATTPEDTAVDIAVQDNDSDPNGDPLLAVVIQTRPTHGTASVNSNGTVLYTPEANYHGPDSFTYTVSDGHDSSGGGSSLPTTVTIHITAVNDLPVATNDSATTLEDTAVEIHVVDNDRDPDGDSLIVATMTPPIHGNASVNANGTVVIYTPTANYNGTDSFTYTVSDGKGATSLPATVTIDVTAVNDPPVTIHDSATTIEDTAVAIDVLANDSDPESDPLVIATLSQPDHGTTVLHSNGTVNYTPSPNYSGPDSFAYTVSDGNGGIGGPANVTITVLPDRDADGIIDSKDNCPNTWNPSQKDADSDSTGDACELDQCFDIENYGLNALCVNNCGGGSGNTTSCADVCKAFGVAYVNSNQCRNAGEVKSRHDGTTRVGNNYCKANNPAQLSCCKCDKFNKRMLSQLRGSWA